MAGNKTAAGNRSIWRVNISIASLIFISTVFGTKLPLLLAPLWTWSSGQVSTRLCWWLHIRAYRWKYCNCSCYYKYSPYLKFVKQTLFKRLGKLNSSSVLSGSTHLFGFSLFVDWPFWNWTCYVELKKKNSLFLKFFQFQPL